MADPDVDPEDLDLDPPVETGDEDDVAEQQDQQTEEQDDEPEGEDVDASAAQSRQDGDAQRQQPSRGESRQQRLANELREARQRESDLNRRLDALIAGQRQPAPQGESPEARANRMSLLTPEERIREELNEARQGFAREQQALRFAVVDGNDRAAFEAKATVDPFYAKWKPKVEAELQTLRQKGQNVDREKLMYYLVGKAAIEGRGQDKGKQRRDAARRVDAQRTRPSNSGSDVAPARRDRGNSLERRLENQSL